MADEPKEVVQEEPQPGTPEYDAKMSALADSRMGADDGDNPNEKADVQEDEGSEEQSFEKPEGIPDKYWDAETGVVDYASMAKETEYWRNKAQGKETPEGKPEDKPEDNPDADAAEKALESKGLNMDDFSQEYAETGELSDKSYEALEKAGIPREMVDDYISGQEALVNQTRTEILNDFGGDEGFSKMVDWAKQNLDPKEIQEYNQQVASADKTTVKNAIAALNAKMVAAEGKQPNLIEGDGSVAVNSGYQSRTEISKAMQDPKYKTDSAYRAQVEAKLAKTDMKAFSA